MLRVRYEARLGFHEQLAAYASRLTAYPQADPATLKTSRQAFRPSIPMRAAALSLAFVLTAFAGCSVEAPPEPLSAHPGALLTIPADDAAAVRNVKFTSATFEAIEEPLWTESGAVVVAVPVYVDAATRRPSAGSVEFSLSTDGASYGPATRLEITELPSTTAVPRGAIAAAGFRLLARSAMHRVAELAFFQAALGSPSNQSGGLSLTSEIDAQMALASQATAMAENIEGSPDSFPAEALADADAAFGLWLSALASVDRVQTMKDPGNGARVSSFSVILDMATLENVRSAFSDIRTTLELKSLERGSVLQKMVGATKALTGWAERFDLEIPGEIGPLVGIATGQTGAAQGTKGFLDSFFGDVQQGMTATVTGADFEETPLQEHARGLVDGFVESGAENLGVVRGIPASDAYAAFEDGVKIADAALGLIGGDARAALKTELGTVDHHLGGGWITGTVDGSRTESGLDPARVDLGGGALERPLSGFTRKDGYYAIPAPANAAEGIHAIQAFDPVSEAPVTEATPVDLAALENGEDVAVPPIAELPPAPDEYEAALSGTWGSVSGYGGCTWALSYSGHVTIVLPPDPADGGNVFADLTAYWSGGSCDPWTGEGSASGDITMRTTNLFSATLNGFIEEHPMVVTIEGNSAGSVPWAKAKVTVTWEPEVTPQRTESRVDLVFARR